MSSRIFLDKGGITGIGIPDLPQESSGDDEPVGVHSDVSFLMSIHQPRLLKPDFVPEAVALQLQ